ncbi:MAG: hypothetical protein ACI3W5_15640 [Faecousia sp.]
MKKANVALYIRFARLEQLSGEAQAKALKPRAEIADPFTEQGSDLVASQLVQVVIDGKADRVLVQRADMLPAAVIDTIAKHGGKIECVKDCPASPER